jgi:hypothetical protein
MHLFSPSILYLSMDLTIVLLSTDIQNWQDYNAFQLPYSTAQCDLIGMSHHHESCIRRLLLLLRLDGVQGQHVLRCQQGQWKS